MLEGHWQQAKEEDAEANTCDEDEAKVENLRNERTGWSRETVVPTQSQHGECRKNSQQCPDRPGTDDRLPKLRFVDHESA